MSLDQQTHLQETSPRAALLILLLSAVLLALPASADWLITQEQNKMIETQGPWSVEGDTLTYTDTEGHEQQVPLARINLVASEKLTALKAARPVVPPRSAPGSSAPQLSAPPSSAPEAGATTADTARADSDEPKVTLYMTSWCGYCRRTSSLLKALQVDFVEKDIEQDPEAAKEYRQKAKGYSGIPVVDINGRIVKGFKATLIRDLVEDLKRREAAAASSEAGR